LQNADGEGAVAAEGASLAVVASLIHGLV